jgi:hypothetical protein
VPKEIEIIGNKYENPEIDYFALEVNNESNWCVRIIKKLRNRI